MPRQRRTEQEQAVLRTAARMATDCRPRKKKAVGSRVPTARTAARAGQLERLVQRVERCIETDDWEDEAASLLIGLFCWAHVHVYGVDAIPEVRRYFLTAVRGAQRLQAQEFGGSFEAVRDYVRWVWAREADREEWRRKNTGYGKRLTWHNVFIDRALVTDMRIEEARTGGPQ